MATHLSALAVSALLALASAGSASAGPLEDALRAHCTVDPRLDTAAHAALTATERPDATALRALAERSGLAAPAVHAAVVRGDDEASRAEAVGTWLTDHHALPGLSRCATATADGLTAVAVVPRSADVAPLDPGAATGASRDYAFELPVGTREPALLLARPSGEVGRMALAAGGPTHVVFNQPGDWVLQLVAATDTGPTPLATWHVRVGGAAPEGTPGAPPARPISAARDVLAAVNALRARAGVGSLRADPLLAAVARDYADRLAARREVAHGRGPGDSPVARMEAAHVGAERVAENVARAPSLAAAHARLMGSPSHRANLLDPDVDTAGLGVAQAGGSVYLVELFATRPGLR